MLERLVSNTTDQILGGDSLHQSLIRISFGFQCITYGPRLNQNIRRWVRIQKKEAKAEGSYIRENRPGQRRASPPKQVRKRTRSEE